MSNDAVPTWDWQELLNATGGRIATDDHLPEAASVTGVAIDSRVLQPGNLFVALPGDLSDRFHVSSSSTRDGHDYVAGALRAGAAAALVSRTVDVPLTQILVQDTVSALWALARAARARLSGEVVAVTGSSGKTTAKSMLQAALHGFAMPGSLNNHLGVPLSLVNTPPGARTAIFEIGTSSPGEIEPLSRMVSPHVALVLNVHPAHIANFADLGALRKEKLSISRGLASDGVLVLHDELAAFSDHAKLVTFGESGSANIRLMELLGDQARYQTPHGKLKARVPGGGHHRALTLAAVMACLHALGRDLKRAMQLPADCVPNGRGSAQEVGGITVVDDSYNANPASMRAALVAFLERPAARRFVLLGEMLELGEDSDHHHRQLAAQLGSFDGVWLVGEAMAVIEPLANERGRVKEAGDELIAGICQQLAPGDALLVKGSNRVFWAGGFTDKLRSMLAQS